MTLAAPTSKDRTSDPFIASDLAKQSNELCLIVSDMHCAGCMRKIERGLSELEPVTWARTNLSTKRVTVRWTGDDLSVDDIVGKLDDIGFAAVPFNPELLTGGNEAQRKKMLLALAVAGFAAANVMLLSVSVWSGNAGGMDRETRDFLHWISALIALPAVAYAGRIFFASAWSALKARALNMDVPISLAVILATGMSLFETIRGGEEVYFDASVTLLFFLLIGRYLDLAMRNRACSAAQNLLGLRASAATRINPDGSYSQVPIEAIEPGMDVLVPVGAHVPVDGSVRKGESEIDTSLVTGESLPVRVEEGSEVFAGTINLSSPLEVKVTKPEHETLLAEIVRLMEAAEQGRAGFVRIADRVARFYAPAVHILAALAFVAWLLIGASVHQALMIAIAVLIVTCPCALGLAVPVVQVVASGRLMRRGILLKAADGLERLATVNHIVFDKTGTLTEGRLTLSGGGDQRALILGASLARSSRHPLSQALVEAARGEALLAADHIEEVPGEGLTGEVEGYSVRLGRLDFVDPAAKAPDATGPELWIKLADEAPQQFRFEDQLREDAVDVISSLRQKGYKLTLLSGDRAPVVAAMAKTLGLTDYQSELRPADKIAALEEMKERGDQVLMVGDGLNDAPALRAANASMSPASAADISQTAADFVFQSARLAPVLEAIKVARGSRALVLQNFGLAAVYNAIAIPLAFFGIVTPLIAAIAMSSSSILVTVNALRLSGRESR